MAIVEALTCKENGEGEVIAFLVVLSDVSCTRVYSRVYPPSGLVHGYADP